jgi:NADH:ubiquinone oxidoreductase subunit 6 (subunit J)
MTAALFLKILLIAAMVGTVVALVLGLFALLKDGKEASLRSNKMMRLRILFQALAIIIFSLLLFFKAT